MGLAMVYGIVRRHGGDIDIESTPGVGTTFRLRLPVAHTDQPEDDDDASAVGDARHMNVLVVDDDPRVRELLTKYMMREGHSVVCAANGQQALSEFRRGEFDLTITDRAMPEMNGDQLARAVKAIDPHKPVIMLTGFAEMMRTADERHDAVDLVMDKPVSLRALRRALAAVTRPASDAPPTRVAFRLDAPEAGQVSLVGDFNDWDPAACRLTRQASGTWTVEIAVPPGAYEYRYIVDGDWVNDTHRAERVPNAFGSENSLVRV
jgi:DNA-binding response OmpR family regulator